VAVTGPNGVRSVPATLSGGRWYAATQLAPGERALLPVGGLVDEFGETNGTAISLLTA
jgi:hypothetical protein